MTTTRSVFSLAMVALASAGCADEAVAPNRGSGPSGSGGSGANDGGSAGSTSSAMGGNGMGGAGGTESPPDYALCDDPPVDYPAGPYGTEVGDTIALLDLEGWVNADGVGLANAQPFVPFGTDAIRSAGSSHVMLHLAATW